MKKPILTTKNKKLESTGNLHAVVADRNIALGVFTTAQLRKIEAIQRGIGTSWRTGFVL